jgi:hypothetical protein
MNIWANKTPVLIKDGLFSVSDATKELEYAQDMFGGKGKRLPLADLDPVARPLMLPTQSGGTCYFHAFMNMLVNKPAFKKELADHLWRRLRANRFFVPGPNVALAAFHGSAAQIVRDSGSAGTCAVKFAWIHDTVMLHALGSAWSVDHVRKGDVDVEATHAVLLRRQSSIQDIVAKPLPPRSLFQKLLAKDDRLSRQVVAALEGGGIVDAAARVMRACGLTVTYHPGSTSLIAEIPGSDDSPRAILAIKLVDVRNAGRKIISEYVTSDGERKQFPQLKTNGFDRSGMLAITNRGNGGHAVAYVRGDEDASEYVSVIDSNGFFMPDVNRNFFPIRALHGLGYGDTMNVYAAYSAVSASDASVGGGVQQEACVEPDLKDIGHLLLMVDGSDALDANTAAAIDALMDMVDVDKDDEHVHVGGSRSLSTWAGLAIVTLAASVFGSLWA